MTISIELFRPNSDEREAEAVKEVIESKWWGLGPKTKEFEENFAAYIGVKHAIAVNSCTAALQLAVNALPKLPVIVPAISFIATAFAPIYERRLVYFADVEEDYLTIDTQSVERIKEEKQIKQAIIIPVQLYGNLAMGDIKDDFIIEDCAHACGTYIDAHPNKYYAGSFGIISCFSFHAVKNLACGDGGMVCTNDDEIAKKIRKQRWFGISKSTFERNDTAEDKTVYGWEYEVDDIGYKMHANDISSSIGLVQLDKLEAGNERRREITDIYNRELANEDWIRTPKKQEGVISASHIYAIRTEHRDKLNLFLKEKGVATGVHYRPMYQFEYHDKYPFLNQPNPDCPVADREWKKLLSLPCYPSLTEIEQMYIIDRIKEFGRKL